MATIGFIYIVSYLIFSPFAFATDDTIDFQPDENVYFIENKDKTLLYTPIERPPKALPLSTYIDDTDTSIDTSLKFKEFAVESLKKTIFPYSSEFTYVSTELFDIYEHVYLTYHDFEYKNCLGKSNARILTSYENCRIDIFEKKFARNESYICAAEKCVVKFSFKTIMGDKTTKSWKAGGKITFSSKGKVGIPFVAEGEIGIAIEVSGEYGEAYEKSTSQESLLETSIDMVKYQIGIPVIVTAGIRCDVSVRQISNSFVLGHNDTGYISEKLVPCMKQKWRWGYSDLPFNDADVLIPLFDEKNEMLKIKYIQIQNIFNGKNN